MIYLDAKKKKQKQNKTKQTNKQTNKQKKQDPLGTRLSMGTAT